MWLMRVLLDTDVLLDSLLQRTPWHLESDEILRRAAGGEVHLAVVSLTLANLFYVGRRIVGAERARAEVRRVVMTFEVLSVDRQTILDADSLPGADFEDNIQMAAALTAAVDAIVTRNTQDFSASTIPVLTPPELLSRLISPTITRR